jgi:hypothetical protein
MPRLSFFQQQKIFKIEAVNCLLSSKGSEDYAIPVPSNLREKDIPIQPETTCQVWVLKIFQFLKIFPSFSAPLKHSKRHRSSHIFEDLKFDPDLQGFRCSVKAKVQKYGLIGSFRAFQEG